MENDNATQTDALEEVVEASEDAPVEEVSLTPSSRQKALEEIYERRSKEVLEESVEEEEEYRHRVEADANDLDARFELAQALAASGKYKDALTEYLEIVKKDRKFRDEGARKSILEIFEVIGARSEIAEHFREELAKVLFS